MTDPMTAAELDAIEQRTDAATDGPWVREWSTPDQWWIIHGQPNPAKGDDRMVCPEVATLNHREDWTADAEFIAHARGDVPALLAEVRRLRAMEQRVREVHEWRCLECDGIDPDASPMCADCYEPWPCPTIVGLDGGE